MNGDSVEVLAAVVCSDALTVMAPYTIMALMVSIRREMANPTQAFSKPEDRNNNLSATLYNPI